MIVELKGKTHRKDNQVQDQKMTNANTIEGTLTRGYNNKKEQRNKLPY